MSNPVVQDFIQGLYSLSPSLQAVRPVVEVSSNAVVVVDEEEVHLVVVVVAEDVVVPGEDPM